MALLSLSQPALRLCFVISVVILAITATTVRAKNAEEEAEESQQQKAYHDPNFRVGRWGQYGKIQHGPDWLHREMKRYDRELQDRARNDPILRALTETAQSQQQQKQQQNRRSPVRDTLPPHPWERPSPLTHSGIPPLVVHVPMLEGTADSELEVHQRLLRQEAESRATPSMSNIATEERDLPAQGQPLPQAYLDRVAGIAVDAGFHYMGLAAPSIWPDRHVFHANPDHVSKLMRNLLERSDVTSTHNKTLIDLHQHGVLPPKAWRSEANRDRMPRVPPTDPDYYPPLDAEAWHRQAVAFSWMMREPDQDGTTTVNAIRDWELRFEKAMREHNEQTRRHAAEQQQWQTWARRVQSHPPFRQHRRQMLQQLQQNLEQAQGVSEVQPQYPQPRVLRARVRLPRQPTSWQSYRERWDAAVEDRRPAKQLRSAGDPTQRVVGDPMLTEQWNLYDAMQWGDLPPAPHAMRPNLVAGPAIWDVLGYDGDQVGIGVVDSGIELGHPELHPRYARATSIDALNPTRNRPPIPVDPWTETHGTQAAGVAVAQRGNGVCGSGVAPGARLGAIRLLGHRSPTDAEEAAAISHACRPHGREASRSALINHIFSCSWGPMDDGADLRGPGPLAARALEACVHQSGRQGKGSIYVWAGGNGRTQEDNVNFDGYANRPETIAVAAVDDAGYQAWYSEPGACLLVSAPSSGASSGIVSSDPSGPAGLSVGQCTRNFGGTSAAAPSVAGVVALMLQAAPDLGWRDVQHILVRSSYRIMYDDRREPWTQTEAGYWHSHGYGFGLVNATRAVLLSLTWRTLHPRHAVRHQTAILSAGRTWDGHNWQERNEQRKANRTQLTLEGAQKEARTRRAESPHKRLPVDTTGYHPDSGNPRMPEIQHVSHPPIDEQEATTTSTSSPDKEKLEKGPPEGVLKSMFLFLPRYAVYRARKFADSIQTIADEARARRIEATRELAPNRVRELEAADGSSVVAIPPGFSAHFEWVWPGTGPDANEPGADDMNRLEHVGLRLDASLPSGRGLLRIWLCAPSGTCSLMAQAPRTHDRHTKIEGNRWTYWSVRHWDERPVYPEDLTGHGPGTWSLRVTHTWPTDPEARHRMRNFRVRNPERVDAVIRWWQVDFRGRLVHQE